MALSARAKEATVVKAVGHNLALLPAEERARIELDKQAHFLMWRRDRKQVDRAGILAAIEAVDEVHRAWFRKRLNEIRSAG